MRNYKIFSLNCEAKLTLTNLLDESMKFHECSKASCITSQMHTRLLILNRPIVKNKVEDVSNQ